VKQITAIFIFLLIISIKCNSQVINGDELKNHLIHQSWNIERIQGLNNRIPDAPIYSFKDFKIIHQDNLIKKNNIKIVDAVTWKIIERGPKVYVIIYHSLNKTKVYKFDSGDIENIVTLFEDSGIKRQPIETLEKLILKNETNL